MWPNLLAIAMAHLPRVTAYWHPFTARELNDRGEWVSEYGPAVPVTGAFQAMDNERVKEYGLDETRFYALFYASVPLKQARAQSSPDKVLINGDEYVVVRVTDWYVQNGWTGTVLEKVS